VLILVPSLPLWFGLMDVTSNSPGD